MARWSTPSGTLRRRATGPRRAGLAEPDRLVLPFVMTGSGELLAALPRHETAHAALLADILDVVHGSSLAAKDQLSPGSGEVVMRLRLRRD